MGTSSGVLTEADLVELEAAAERYRQAWAATPKIGDRLLPGNHHRLYRARKALETALVKHHVALIAAARAGQPGRPMQPQCWDSDPD